jgi:2-iminobutanoate/2-iminopropanoate deaminase
MRLEAVKTDLPSLNLPFSQGLKAGNLVFISGQGPVGKDGKIVEGDFRAQARLTLANVRRVVEGAGSDLEHVVSTTVYLNDLSDFAAMNEVYQEFFRTEPRPARATVQAGLLFGMKIEVQGVAVVP